MQLLTQFCVIQTYRNIFCTWIAGVSSVSALRPVGETSRTGNAELRCFFFSDGFCQIAVQKGYTLFTIYKKFVFIPFSVLGNINVFNFCQFNGVKKASGFNFFFCFFQIHFSSFSILVFKNSFIYFWLCWVFVAGWAFL